MEIKNVKVLKPFGPLVMLAQLPDNMIKLLNELIETMFTNRFTQVIIYHLRNFGKDYYEKNDNNK